MLPFLAGIVWRWPAVEQKKGAHPLGFCTNGTDDLALGCSIIFGSQNLTANSTRRIHITPAIPNNTFFRFRKMNITDKFDKLHLIPLLMSMCLLGR
jgi:hypothetical protein